MEINLPANLSSPYQRPKLVKHMEFIEHIVSLFQRLPPLGVLGMMFLVQYIENIFPPSPGDMLLVFGGTLIGLGTVGFFPSLLLATIGSTLGFMTAYYLGRSFEMRILHGRLGRFLPKAAILKVEGWFKRFGPGVILINRFLAGTRAVIPYFAGMSRTAPLLTAGMSTISAALWNTLLLYLGMVFGENWRVVAGYLVTYSKAMSVLIAVAIALLLGFYLKQKRRAAYSASKTE
ncbi:MAG TPA: DedA family protein [Blastocatellia bacterium]|nr:DedA family protein [Blastocatellia bacterium]